MDRGGGSAGNSRDNNGSESDDDIDREDHNREDHVHLAIRTLRRQQVVPINAQQPRPSVPQQPPPVQPRPQPPQQVPPAQPRPQPSQQVPPALSHPPAQPRNQQFPTTQPHPPEPQQVSSTRPRPVLSQLLPPTQPHPQAPPTQPHPPEPWQVPSTQPWPLQLPPTQPHPQAPPTQPHSPEPRQAPPTQLHPTEPRQAPPTQLHPTEPWQVPSTQPRPLLPQQLPPTQPHPPEPQQAPPTQLQPRTAMLLPLPNTQQRPVPSLGRLPPQQCPSLQPQPPQRAPSGPSQHSWSLSSQEQSLSEQPGPSGLGMAFHHGPHALGGSSSSSSDSSRGQLVPEVQTATPEGSSRQPPADSHPYHISPSQDLFMGGASQEPTSFDLSIPGPPATGIASDLAVFQAQQRRREAEQRQRDHQAFLAGIEEGRQQNRGSRDGEGVHGEEEETEESQSEPEAIILPDGRRIIPVDRSRRIQAELARLQQHRTSRRFRVPGGTDSSPSSDDNPAHAMKVRAQQQLRQYGVPERPDLSLVSRQASRNQDPIAIASDSESSSEPVVVPGGGSRLSPRTTHVVPKISSAKIKRIQQRTEMQARLRRESEGGLDTIPEHSSSTMETGSSAGSHVNDTEATLSMAEDGGGAQENEEMGGEGLQMEGAASGTAEGRHSSPEDQREVLSSEGGGSQPHPSEEAGSGAIPSHGFLTATSQSELSDDVPDPSHPRLRRPSSQRQQASVNCPPPPSEDEIIILEGEEEQMTPVDVIRAGPPDWGAGTDASTEYPSTLNTTSSGTTSSSDSASITAMSSGRQSASVDSDGQTLSQLATQSSSLESDTSVRISSQTPSQTLPVSSTPQDSLRMPPPHHVLGSPGLAARKRTSDETTTSTSTATSSSSGELEKLLASRRVHNPPCSLSSESVAPAGVPAPPQTPESQKMEFESLEPSPFALDSQTPEDLPGGGTSEVSEVIPGTPPFGEPMQVAPSHQGSAGHLAASQELFQDTSNSQEDLGNQIPKWCEELSTSPEADSQEGSMSQPVKRPRPRETPTSGSDHASSGSTHQPRPKRRRTIGSSASSSIDLLPKWKEDSSSRSALGPSVQAQPTAVEARLRRSSSTSERGGSDKGSGKGSGESRGSGSSVGNVGSSSSSSSGNISTSASSASHTSSSDISSSGRSSDTASSLGRTISSETLSGSGGSSRGAGSGGSKGHSSDSSASQQRHSGDSSKGEIEEGEEVRSQERSLTDERQRETRSLDRERSFSEGSQPSQLQKPMDPSPGHEGGVSSSGSSSGGGTGSSASVDTSFGKSQGSQSAPALSLSAEEVVVIEESVPETGVSDLADGRPMQGEAERQQDVASSWQLQLSSGSAGSRLASTEETGMRSQCPMEQPIPSEVPVAPGSPELLQETSELPEDMQASPEILLPEPGPPHQISSTPEASTVVGLQHRIPPNQSSVEAMEVDHPHADTSSQTSFALQLSQSQVFSTPMSGVLSPTHMPRETSTTSSRPLGTSYGSLEDIEEHEKECPNLMEISHASTSVSDESVGSQKQSDTSTTSSSSQSGRGSGSGGPDSTPPDGGGGANGGSRGGVAGEGGGDAVDGDEDHGVNRSGSDGGSQEADDKGSEGAGHEKSREDSAASIAKASPSDSYRRVAAEEQVSKLVLQKKAPDVTPIQPSTAPFKARPIPVYESIRCESSPEGSECSAGQGRLLQDLRVGGSAAAVVVSASQPGAAAGSQLRSTESQHSMEVSQLTSSGTPFQLQLPQGGLLKPLQCITPPSQSTHRTSPEASDPSSMKVPRATVSDSNNGGISIFSPSEVNASFLKSATPSESQQNRAGAQSQGQPLFVITGGVVGCEGAGDSPSLGGRDSSYQPEENRESRGESRRQRWTRSQVSESERVTGGPTAGDANGKVASQDSSEGDRTLQNGKETASQVEQAAGLTEPSKDAEIPRASTCRDISTTISIGSQNQTARVAHTGSSVPSSPPSCEISNVKSPTPLSPRKSLSLRKTRSSPAKGNKRKIIPNGALGLADNFNHSAPNMATASELNARTIAAGTSEKTPGFVLGINSQAVDSQMLEDSQFVLPTVSVPSDSQSSQTSEFSLNQFRIERPPAHPTGAPPANMARKPHSPPPTSIFSNVRASKRVSRLPPTTNLVPPGSNDPYEFHSQSLNMETQHERGGAERHTDLHRACLDQNTSESTLDHRSERQHDVNMSGQALGVCGDGVNEGDSPKDSHNTPPADANVSNWSSQEGPKGSVEGRTCETVSETQPDSSEHTEAVQLAAGSTRVQESRQQQIAVSHHHESNPRPQPPSPTSPHNCTPSLATPISQSLPFTSPSLLMAPDYLQQLTQQYGVEGQQYELRHVRTFKTVLERRLVSIEMKKGAEVLDTRTFMDDLRPQYSHLDSIEAVFFVPSPENPTVVSIPACGGMNSPAPSLVGNMQPPSIASTSNCSAFLQSPAAMATPFQLYPRTPSSATPQFRPQQGISPVRLVQPACQVDKSGFTRPPQPLNEQPSMTATADCEPTPSATCRESPIPRGQRQGMSTPRGRETGGARLPASVGPSSGASVRREDRGASQKRPLVLASGIHTRSKKRQVTTPTTTSSAGTSGSRGTLSTPSPSRSTPTKSRMKNAGGRGAVKKSASGRGEGTGEDRLGKDATSERGQVQEAQQREAADGHGSNSTSTPGGIAVGAYVMAKWRYSQWYPATVTAVAKTGRLAVCYADDEKGTVAPSGVFPLHQVKPGVSVIAQEDEEEGLPEASGQFVKFIDSSLGEFILEVAGRGTVRCATGRMTLTSAAAQACLKKPTLADMSPAPSRKRNASSSSASSERSSQVPAKRRKTSSSPRTTATIEAEDEVPSSQRTLFEGYTFLLTQRPKDDKQCTDTASPPPQLVDRVLIGSQLRNRRGRVLDHYSGERIISNRFFVLSDTHCRTSKYLMGLALGVPPVSYSWITRCIQEGSIVAYEQFLLPAGHSHETKDIVLWEPRRPNSILGGVSVHLQGNDKFKQHWTPILQRTGASVCPKLPSFHRLATAEDSGTVTCDVVICEAADVRVPKSVLHRASTTGMKLLTTEWLVQCLIHATKIEYHSEYLYHPKS